MSNHGKILCYIRGCEDADALRRLLKNARAKGVPEVEKAAFEKLIAIVPQAQPGTLEHDFWKMVHAFEHMRSEENGRRTLLSRTRQKVDRVGVQQTLADWALDTKSTLGFAILLERDLPELTGEAIVLRHPGRFSEEVRSSARARLEQAGVDVERLQSATPA